MAVVQQLTLFEKPKAPAKPKAPKAKKRATGPAALARGEFEPVNPPNLSQDTALWLLGQRSIALQRGKRYVPASIKHPGKMQPDVAGAIIDTYTTPGDRIVDCMGGIGTTGVEGAERGRHVLCVELVRHWANVAYANAVRTALRGAPGTMQVVQGDARALPDIVEMAANSVLTSPWFGHIYEARDVRNMRKLEGREDAGPQYDAALMSPPFGDSNVRHMPSGFDKSGPGGHFSDPQRGYDAALLSPPFGEGREPGKPPGPAEPRAGEWSEYESGAGPSPGWRGLESRTYSPSNNEGRQVDATLFSPPFGPTQTGRGMAMEGINGDGRPPVERGIGVAYDAMIASPAYGEIRQDGGEHQFGSNSAMDNYTGEARVKHRAQRDPSNVGNKKYGTMAKALSIVKRLQAGETIPPEDWPKLTYLEDMALIYWGCLQVLKDGGLCILVLKDYRREKQRVDLVGDTITLMKTVGFVYHDRALAVTSKVEDAKVIVKVSPFVRLNARKPEKNGGAVMLPVGEEVLVYRKEAKKR